MNKEFWLVIERYLYTTRTTVGALNFEYIKDYVRSPLITSKDFYCYTLEDTARPSNIKVYAETCLPGGLECNVSLFENDHYKKTIIFHTEIDKNTIKFGDLSWSGCLAHNGASYEHTEGCILVASKFNPPSYQGNYLTKEPFIYNGMKESLRIVIENKIKEGYTIKARFVNLTQIK
jgi:hypothetical protein